MILYLIRNAFVYNKKESEIYRHAKSMEDKLDSLLQIWAPEFAYNPLLDVSEAQENQVKRKRTNSPGEGSAVRKGKKSKKQYYSGDSENGGSDIISEGEREENEYMQALQRSLEDQDPNDSDFDPHPASGKGRGRGRGRPRGRK